MRFLEVLNSIALKYSVMVDVVMVGSVVQIVLTDVEHLVASECFRKVTSVCFTFWFTQLPASSSLMSS